MHKLGKNKLGACQMKKRRTDSPPRCLKGFAAGLYAIRIAATKNHRGVPRLALQRARNLPPIGIYLMGQ